MGARDETRCCEDDRAWVRRAVRMVAADANRSADTHLHKLPFGTSFGVDLYLKDESTHPTGSLKHRLARSLFLYALCNGWITRDSVVVEASSGSTAVSEAYFAQLLGLKFVAVMTSGTSRSKVDLIERYGGVCEFVNHAGEVYARAEQIAAQTGGHYLDQFTYAERATDWRGNNNIAESIFAQLQLEPHPEPTWIVVGAGTGGTSATIGRYLRYTHAHTKLCVVDPENSAFFHGWVDQEPSFTTDCGSRIEGIGRPRMEPSFQPLVVDRMMCVPDAASIAAIHLLRERTGLYAGGSTGTNLYGALKLAAQMRAAGEQGSIVTLMCDSGDRYATTYYDTDWLADNGFDIAAHRPRLERALEAGEWCDGNESDTGELSATGIRKTAPSTTTTRRSV